MSLHPVSPPRPDAGAGDPVKANAGGVPPPHGPRPTAAVAGDGAHETADTRVRAGYGGYGSGFGGGSPRDRVHLLDYARVIHRRRWPALTVFTLVIVTSALMFAAGPPVYEARVQMLVERETPPVASIRELEQPLSYTEEAYYQTQFKILQSRSLARRTLAALSLWDKPPFNGRLTATAQAHGTGPAAAIRGAAGSVWRFVTGATAGRSAGGRLQPPSRPDAPLPDETAAQARAIDVFLGGLTVAPVRNSRLVDVRYQAQDQDLPATIANGLAREFIAQNLEYRFLASKEASDWLAQRLEEQRRQVEASERALQRYREQHHAVSLDERQNVVVQKLSDLNAAVTKAKTERVQKEAQYQQVLANEQSGAPLDGIPTVLANPFVQQLKGELADLQRQQAQMSDKWGERHPEMVRVQTAIRTAEAKLQTETRKIVEALKNDYQTALAQEQTLTQLLGAQKREALAMNSESIEYGVLQREAATNRQLYDALLQQTKETGISRELKATNIRVIDPAERPQGPVGAGSRTGWILALLGAMVLAGATALFFEYLDNRIKLPDEIETYLGIPFLGLVPSVTPLPGADSGKTPLVSGGAPSHFLESVRIVRTNVLFSSTAEGGKSLLVTSAAPGEGKTMAACNLAIALAQAGQRVLLIDADMRRPRLHEIFQKSQQIGLSNLLVGAALPSRAVRSTTFPGLWLLASGRTPPNPAELLGSTRFKELLGVLMEGFDWVVLDSPPVLAVADTSVLAASASHVLFVVGAEMTAKPAAARAIQQLLRANARIAGAILNRVHVDRHRYYYSNYYRSDYSTCYGVKADPPGAKSHGERQEATP